MTCWHLGYITGAKEPAEEEYKEGIVKRVPLRMAARAGMRTVVWRGTTQPSSQKGGAGMDAENNLRGVDNVGDKGEGAAATTWGVGEDGATELQCIFRRGISYNLILCIL